MSQQQRKRVIPKIRRNRLGRGRTQLPIGVREILQTIISNMDGCRDRDGGPCKGHMVMFGPDQLAIAKAALAASR